MTARDKPLHQAKGKSVCRWPHNAVIFQLVLDRNIETSNLLIYSPIQKTMWDVASNVSYPEFFFTSYIPT